MGGTTLSRCRITFIMEWKVEERVFWKQTDRNWNNWICQSDSMEMLGSINLILVKANKFVSIDFSVSTRHIREGKDGLELTNQADHVIKLHLELVTDHFFQNDEFLHQVFSVWGSKAQEGQLWFPGTGHSALSWVICKKNVLDAMSEPGTRHDIR